MNYNLIMEAYNDVDFLRNKLSDENSTASDDISKYPLLEKDELAEDSLKLMAAKYLPFLYREELMRKDTSGSTGKYIEVYWRKQDFMRSMFSLWFYRKRFYGINTWDKMCGFYTISHVGLNEEKERLNKNMLEFSKTDLTEERLLEIYGKMQEFQPVWLILQPCIAELLCYVKEKYQLSSFNTVKYIEMTGEELTEDLRGRVHECFGGLVVNQYGANEVNSIAYECPEGNLHCMEDNVYVEIVDDSGNVLPEGEVGNIYVTTCCNYAMPFIRYGIGDIGALKKNTCHCGHKGRILDLKSGRKDDWIKTEDGEKINPYVFVRAAVAVNAVFERCIFQFQIIQEEYQLFSVNLALDDEIEYESVKKVFLDNIGHAKLKNASYKFNFYDKLFPDMNGKRKFFKSEI